MNPSEVVTALVSLFGAGGFTAIVVGFFAYKKAAAEGREGRRETLKPEGLSTPGPLPGSHDIELLANAMSGLASTIGRLSLLCEFQFVQKADREDEFEEWSRVRALQAEVDSLRAAQKR